MGVFVIGVSMYLLVSFIRWFAHQVNGGGPMESPSILMYLLVLPLAIIVLPFKLWADRRKKEES